MAGAKVAIKWHDKQVAAEIRKEMNKRLAVAGEALRAQMVQNISESTRMLGPSKPGEFPHRDTADLAKSIMVIPDAKNMRVEVGSRLNYSLFLELGTVKMAPRPFMRRTLAEMQPRMESIMQGRITDPGKAE